MADKRMMTKKVTDDDNFVNLSSSAQALYLHLSMSADDDGFCNQISASMFKAHASVQDLEALLERRYLYQFNNGVIVIKHWRMANALRKDRYTPTAFQEEFKKLGLKDNGSYTFNNDDEESGCRLVAERLPQNRLDKISLDKSNSNIRKTHITCSNDELFERFWNVYPKKQGKKRTEELFKKLNVDEALLDKMLSSIEKWKTTDQWKRDNGQYIPMPSTWLNGRRWEDEVEVNNTEKNKDDVKWNIETI